MLSMSTSSSDVLAQKPTSPLELKKKNTIILVESEGLLRIFLSESSIVSIEHIN